jgi:hypothetical protein
LTDDECLLDLASLEHAEKPLEKNSAEVLYLKILPHCVNHIYQTNALQALWIFKGMQI